MTATNKEALKIEAREAIAQAQKYLKALDGISDSYENKSTQWLCGLATGVPVGCGAAVVAAHVVGTAIVAVAGSAFVVGGGWGIAVGMLIYRGVTKRERDRRGISSKEEELRALEMQASRLKALGAPKKVLDQVWQAYTAMSAKPASSFAALPSRKMQQLPPAEMLPPHDAAQGAGTGGGGPL